MKMLYVCLLRVHRVVVLNAAFCMTLLMLIEETRDHMEEAYSRAGLVTAWWTARSVSFCLSHHVAVSVFIICRGLCACAVCGFLVQGKTQSL